MARARSLLRQKFERLCVKSRGPNDKFSKAQWGCLCECGTGVLVGAGSLTSGNTKSCGCIHKEETVKRNTVHGFAPHNSARHPLYSTWGGIKNRCYNSKGQDFICYGGRGIFMCRRWRKAFINFLKDMGDRPTGTSIDRMDNNGSYGKWNCKWSTPKEQSNNRR